MKTATQNNLSEKDILKFKKNILSISGALVCLAGAFIYEQIYPEQKIVAAFIYLAGVFIIGVPILVTAVRGLISRNMKSALEILVSIAMIISALSGEFLLAIIIPVILTLVHFLAEKSILGGRDAIESLKKMQADTAILLKDGREIEVNAK